MNNIKLCIFDVDGVLVNSRHFIILQPEMLLQNMIATTVEMMMTTSVLFLLDISCIFLQSMVDISIEDVDDIWELKDTFACEYFDDTILLNENIKSLFDELKSRGMRIALGSNARYTFLEKVINSLGVGDLVDFVTSAQDGKLNQIHTCIKMLWISFWSHPMKLSSLKIVKSVAKSRIRKSRLGL